jgi:hypothetical protein
MGTRTLGFFVLFFVSWSFVAKGATPLNSALMTFGQDDLANCPARVAATAALDNTKILFVPTAYYVLQSATPEPVVHHFCTTKGGECVSFAKIPRSESEELWTQCLQALQDAHADFSVLPHLDEAPGAGAAWRNRVAFDPTGDYNDTNFAQDLLGPLISALKKFPQMKVEFAFEGEMGESAYVYAQSYLNLTEKLKSDPDTSRFKIGMSFNFNSTAGNATNNKNLPAMQKLLNEIDYIGVSAYHSVGVQPMAQDFEANITGMLADMGTYGLQVPANKVFQFSEVGLGGGDNQSDNKMRSQSALGAALCPWSGVLTPYSILTDPWQVPELKELRLEFYLALMSLLSLPTEQTHINAAFTWTSRSWDVQGLVQKEYYDADITQRIRNYNRSIVAGQIVR